MYKLALPVLCTAMALAGCSEIPEPYTIEADVTVDYIDAERRKLKLRTVDQVYNDISVRIYAYDCVNIDALDQSALYKFPMRVTYTVTRSGKAVPNYNILYDQEIICKYLGAKHESK